MYSQILNTCRIRFLDFITKEILVQPPQTPHTSPKNKIAWIVADQPLKFK